MFSIHSSREGQTRNGALTVWPFEAKAACPAHLPLFRDVVGWWCSSHAAVVCGQAAATTRRACKFDASFMFSRCFASGGGYRTKTKKLEAAPHVLLALQTFVFGHVPVGVLLFSAAVNRPAASVPLQELQTAWPDLWGFWAGGFRCPDYCCRHWLRLQPETSFKAFVCGWDGLASVCCQDSNFSTASAFSGRAV